GQRQVAVEGDPVDLPGAGQVEPIGRLDAEARDRDPVLHGDRPTGDIPQRQGGWQVPADDAWRTGAECSPERESESARRTQGRAEPRHRMNDPALRAIVRERALKVSCKP